MKSTKKKGTCTIKFLRQFEQQLDWASVLNNFRIKIDFVLVFDYQDRMAWPELLRNFDKIKNFTEALLIGDKFANRLDLRVFHAKFVDRFKQHPPEWFLERHFDQMDSGKISTFPQLSVPFICKFKHRLNWRAVTRHNLHLACNSFLDNYGIELLDYIYWPLFPFIDDLSTDNFERFCFVLPSSYF